MTPTNHFFKIFQDRFRDYEHPVEKDIWFAIETDLAIKDKNKRTRRIVLYSSIAASLLLPVLFITLFNSGEKSGKSMQFAKFSVISPQGNSIHSKKPKDNALREKILYANQFSSKEKSDKKLFDNKKTEKNIPIENTNQIQPIEKQDETPHEKQIEKENITGDELDKKLKEFENTGKEASPILEITAQTQKKNKKKDVFFNLYAGNSSSGSSKNSIQGEILQTRNTSIFSAANEGLISLDEIHQPGGELLAYRLVLMDNITKKQVDNNSQESYPETEISYHAPISFGFTVSKSISDKIAIETGLTYSYLSSEEKFDSESYFSKKQKLHYLGIPVKIRYSFFDKSGFSIYGSLGGMVEKSVKGTSTNFYFINNESLLEKTNNLNIKELQWSLLGGLGVSYQIYGPLQIYAEPGVAYYFDDGSNVKTIRQDKPFNFNFQGGIRLSF